jgi:sugar phosphate isomerase/epimerase
MIGVERMITIYSWFGYELPIKERYSLIKRAGFDGVTIWWDDDFDKIDFRLQPKDALDAGLWVENMHTPYNGNTNLWLDNLDGEEVTKRLINCIEDCDIYKIPTMVVHPTSGNPPLVNEIALNCA